jgi:hypothetical protein
LLRLADVSGIDVEVALKARLEKNRKKYPLQDDKGRSGLVCEANEVEKEKEKEKGKVEGEG